MDSSNAIVETAAELAPPVRPAAVLRGTARGLEIHVWAAAPTDAIAAAIQKRLDEAPGFFRGSDVRVRVEEGPLATGALTQLDEIAQMFELKIVEVGAVKAARVTASDDDAVPQVAFAAGSAPGTIEKPAPLSLAKSDPAAASLSGTDAVLQADGFDDEPTGVALVSAAAAIEPPAAAPVPANTDAEVTQTAAPLALAATPEIDLATAAGTRIVIGPIRSGVILDHTGHLFIFGDVNPGAEVRATGNIIVLGRLRGTAHAGINQELAFVLALRLEPQQLRIGRMVARAADSDLPSAEAEIAYGTSDRIVVERYAGRLPRNLATSI